MKTLERVIISLLVVCALLTYGAQAYRAGQKAGRASRITEMLAMQADLKTCEDNWYNSEGGQQ